MSLEIHLRGHLIDFYTSKLNRQFIYKINFSWPSNSWEGNCTHVVYLYQKPQLKFSTRMQIAKSAMISRATIDLGRNGLSMQSIIRKLLGSWRLRAVRDLDLGQSGTSNGHDHQLLNLHAVTLHEWPIPAPYYQHQHFHQDKNSNRHIHQHHEY